MAPAAPGGRADLQLVRPFILATLDTMKAQCGLDVASKEPHLKTSEEDTKKDFAAVFSVFSQGTNVSLCMGFSKSVHEQLLRRLPPSKSNIPGHDAVRDLVGVIFSKARGLAKIDGRVLNRGVPAIIEGNSVEVTYLTTSAPIVVPFDTPLGPFQLELILET